MSTTLFVMAEHRAAYASWCGRQGLKQCDAVYVNAPEKLEGRPVSPAQFAFVDGWQKNKRHIELMAAYGHATLRHWTAAK